MQRELIPSIPSSERPVKAEHSFRRDLKLLLRHRDWGWNVPAEDIDFLEYDQAQPVALFEYKCIVYLDEAPRLNIESSNLKALTALAERAALPAFLVFYTPDIRRFSIRPLNEIAQRKKPPEGAIWEYQFVEFLYWLRHRPIPPEIAQGLWGVQ